MRDQLILSDNGHMLSSKMLALANAFQYYDPELEVQWIPPEYRTKNGAPEYQLVHHSSKFGSYVIGRWYERDEPEQVWLRFLAGDTRKRDVLKELEAQDAEEDILRTKHWEDSEAERIDLVAFMMSARNYLQMRDYRGDLVKFDEYRQKRRI